MVAAGGVGRQDVTEIGAVLAGVAGGRRDSEEISLFDSTGLAIQDLGIVAAVHEAWTAGKIDAPQISLL